MDYLKYFNLRTEPFAHALLSQFYFASKQHADALNRLTYAARSMKGLALLVGDVGRGKSTLARRLLDSLPENEYEAAMLVVVHAAAGPTWLLRRLASQLGVMTPASEPLTLVGQLYERLVEIHETGKRTVVLIDEAQMLNSRELMEEFRGLLNLEVPGHKLITFIFFGLPELEDNLRLDPPLAQRVALRYHLKALAEADTSAYVRHRLEAAGADEEIFGAAALREVHRYTQGVPRLINTLCDNILLELFFTRERRARPDIVAAVAQNLSLKVDSAGPVPEVPAAVPPPVVEEPELEFDLDVHLSSGDQDEASAIEVVERNYSGQVDLPRSLSEEAENIAAQVAVESASNDELVNLMPNPAEESLDDVGNGWAGVQPVGAILGNNPVPIPPIPIPPAAVPPPPEDAPRARPAPAALRPPPPPPPSSRAVDLLADVDDLLAELSKPGN